MPRHPRLDLPGIAQHIVQRGVDRQACFFRSEDRRHYLGALREAAWKNGCEIHAYVLMTNHVHLLVTPPHAGAVSRMMQGVGRNYVRYVNDAARRTGPLWEGRFKSSLVDNERYVLACYRYIELNPVRAGIVGQARAYPWSSHRANAFGEPDGLVRPHPAFSGLSADEGGRAAIYRDLVDRGTPNPELGDIRLHLQRQRALGSPTFQQQIESQLGRRAGLGRPGRPPKRETPEKVL